MSCLSEEALRAIIAYTAELRLKRGYSWPDGAQERIYLACKGLPNVECADAMQREITAIEHGA